MLEQLGLGIKVDLQNDMSRKVDPLIRDLQRLKAESQDTASRITNSNRLLGESYDKYFKADRIKDMNTAMRGTGAIINDVTGRLINATVAMNNFNNATNRMTAMSNWNQMQSDILRTQRMLAEMGYGMSRVQEKKFDLANYQMVNYQMKEVADRIALTEKAIKQLNKAPDSAHTRKELALAKTALEAYRSEYGKLNDQQKKFAELSGYKFINGELIKMPGLATQASNRLKGLFSLDMLASARMAYGLIDRNNKAIMGTGFTAMEAKQKLTQYAGQLMMIGGIMSMIVTPAILLATGGMLAFGASIEKAQNLMQARTGVSDMMMDKNTNGFDDRIQNVRIRTGAERTDIAKTMAYTYNNVTHDMNGIQDLTIKGHEFAKTWGVDAVSAIQGFRRISSKLGVDEAKGLDLYALALEKTNGNHEKAVDYALKHHRALEKVNGSTQAFERMINGNHRGAIEKWRVAIGEVAGGFQELYEGIQGTLGKMGDFVAGIAKANKEFMQANPALATFLAHTLLIGGLFFASIGPILLLTGGLMRYGQVVKGVTASLFGLTKGGFAVLSPTAQMAADRMNLVTRAIARFPQTLLSTIPLLYTLIRALPGVAIAMMKANPVVTGLVGAWIAYEKNLYGFGDAIDRIKNKITTNWNTIRSLFIDGLPTDKASLSILGDLSKTEEFFGRVQGLALIFKNTIRDWGKESVDYNDKEQGLLRFFGLTGFAEGLANASGNIENFIGGFVEGFNKAVEVGKTFVSDVWDAMYDRLVKMEPYIIKTWNFFDKLFGGTGDAQRFGDAIDKMLGKADEWYQFGTIAGGLVASLIALKAIGIISSPFVKMGKGAWSVARGLGSILTKLGKLPKSKNVNVNYTSSGVPVAGVPGQTPGARAFVPVPVGGGVGQRYQEPGTTPSRFGGMFAPILTPIGDFRRGLSGEKRTRFKGNTSRAERAGQFMSPLAQTPDKNTRMGRRKSPLSKMVSFTAKWTGLSLLGKQASQAGTRYGKALGRGISAGMIATKLFMGVEAEAGRAGTRSGKKLASNAKKEARKQRWKEFFLGVEPEASRAGTRSGRSLQNNMRKNALRGRQGFVKRMFTGFNRGALTAGKTAGKTLGSTISKTGRAGLTAGKLFGKVVTGTAKTAGKIGRGIVRGVGSLVLKGLPRVFMLGLRAIPYLGWAIMAWDAISLIFKNWDKITEAAGKAWEWIKTDGVEMFLGLLDSAIEVGADIGKAIGSAIESALGSAVEWGKGKLAELGSSIAGLVGMGDEKPKKKKKKEYARGGFITHPHMGLVGEAGAEVIIPLGHNMRDRAMGLFKQTAQMLGVTPYAEGGVVGTAPQQANAPVRSQSQRTSSPNIDQSVKIEKIEVKLPPVSGASSDDHNVARRQAQNFIKEVRKILKEEKLRNGRDIPLEEMLLKYV
jgi:hypothetical protein